MKLSRPSYAAIAIAVVACGSTVAVVASHSSPSSCLGVPTTVDRTGAAYTGCEPTGEHLGGPLLNLSDTSPLTPTQVEPYSQQRVNNSTGLSPTGAPGPGASLPTTATTTSKP